MWDASHSTSVTPLSKGCPCYACTSHHRAYIQHLLSAKEMLGWFLIQIHNHTILDSFFANIRSSIQTGTFDAAVAAFEAYYEPRLPEKTGQGPRIRGYQFKSEEHARPEKKNKKKWSGEIGGGARGIDKVVLKGAHGQQPGKKKEMNDVIDDEALVGLVDLVDPEASVGLEDLSIEDAKS